MRSSRVIEIRSSRVIVSHTYNTVSVSSIRYTFENSLNLRLQKGLKAFNSQNNLVIKLTTQTYKNTWDQIISFIDIVTHTHSMTVSVSSIRYTIVCALTLAIAQFQRGWTPYFLVSPSILVNFSGLIM